MMECCLKSGTEKVHCFPITAVPHRENALFTNRLEGVWDCRELFQRHLPFWRSAYQATTFKDD